MYVANLNNRNYCHKKVLTLFLQSFGFKSWLTDMPHTTAVMYFVTQSAIYSKICWINFNCCLSQYSPCLTWCRNQSFFLNVSTYETHKQYAYHQTISCIFNMFCTHYKIMLRTMRYATEHRKWDMLQIKIELKLFMKMSQCSFQCPKVKKFQVVKKGHNIRFHSNSWPYHPVLTFLEQGSEQVQIQVMPLPQFIVTHANYFDTMLHHLFIPTVC